MKTSGKYTVFLISSLLFLLITTRVGACAYSEYGEDLRISMFRIMNGNMWAYSPFQYSAHSFFSSGSNVSLDRARHTREWSNAMNYKGRPEDLELVIFKTPPELFYLLHEKKALAAFFKGNEFIPILIKPENEKFLNYLQISKAIEYWENSIVDPWDGYNTERIAVVAPLKDTIIGELNDILKIEKNPFIKNRAAYQLVRMYFQTDDFENLRETYQHYFDLDDTTSVINPWALHYYAIAEGISGDSIQANYLKSLVFARCDDKKYRMYTTFSRNEYILTETLKKARNDNERATILAMNIINYPGRALPTLIKLEGMKAPSDLMRFLILREINKLEDWLLTTELTISGPAAGSWENESVSEQYLKKNYQSDKLYLSDVISLVRRLKQNSSGQAAQWYSLALAHLLVMNDKNEEALVVLPSENQTGDAGINRQITIEKLFLYSTAQLITQKDKWVLAASLFNRLDSSIANGSENPMTAYSLCQRFSKAMLKQNDMARAMLFLDKATKYKYSTEDWNNNFQNSAKHIIPEFDYYLCGNIDQSGTSSDVEQLIKIIYHDDRNSLDDFLCRQDLPSLNQLTELKGSKLFREGKLRDAMTEWQTLPLEYWAENGSFNDYLGYNIYQPKEIYPEVRNNKRKANKLSILSAIISLEDSILKPSTGKYGNMLKLAHAWYNVSYYGHSWILAHYYKSCEPEAEKMNDAYPGQPSRILDDHDNYINNERAKQLYNKVYIESPDAEQRCEAMAMLQYLAYLDYYDMTSYEDLKTKKFRSPFSPKIWAKYTRTHFYQTMSNTCPLFNSFVRK